MTNPSKTQKTPDTGNEMSDRSGYYDESDSGESNTPTAGGLSVPDGSDLPENVLDPDGSGTTFDAGDVIPSSDGT